MLDIKLYENMQFTAPKVLKRMYALVRICTVSCRQNSQTLNSYQSPTVSSFTKHVFVNSLFLSFISSKVTE